MGIGADLKAKVDTVRNTFLGSNCTYNGTTALGKCAIHDLSPESIRELVGGDFEDEMDRPWARIWVASEKTVATGGKITVDVTGKDWIIRRVNESLCDNVLIEHGCLCVAEAL